MEKKYSLLTKLLGIFTLLWIVTTVIFVCFFNYYEIQAVDIGIGAYINVLIFDATIFTSIAAFLFFNNWKQEVLFTKKLEILEKCLDLNMEMAIHWNNLRYEQKLLDSIFQGSQKIDELDVDALEKKLMNEFFEVYKYSDDLFYLSTKLSLMSGKIYEEYGAYLVSVKNYLDNFEREIEELISEIRNIKLNNIKNYTFNNKILITFMKLSFDCDVELSKSKNIKSIDYKDFIDSNSAKIVPILFDVRRKL